MKFLDANGLALFTKKIFSKFISNISGADNKITVTKGDGTKTEINLNEVIKTDIIAENPPENDDTLKIPSTSWTQEYCKKNYLKIDGTANKAIADKNNLVINENYLKLTGGNLTGDLNTTANIVPQNNGEGSLGAANKHWSAGYIDRVHGTVDMAKGCSRNSFFELYPVSNGNCGISVITPKVVENGGCDSRGTLYVFARPSEHTFNIAINGLGNLMVFRNVIDVENIDNAQIELGIKTIAQTPPTSDNSVQVATTQFVKAQSATMAVNTLAKTEAVNQYWAKEPSGTITQYVELEMNDEQEIDVLFPISFPQKCMFLDVEIINADKDTNLYCAFHTVERTVDGAKLLKVGTGSPKKIVVRAVGI